MAKQIVWSHTKQLHFLVLVFIVFSVSLSMLWLYSPFSLHEFQYILSFPSSYNQYKEYTSININFPETNYSIDSFWNHADFIKKYELITKQMDESLIYSYSYQELQKMYELFGCDKYKQENCQHGVSSKCKIHESFECDMPKLTNNGANCNLNDLKGIIINNYKQNRVPRLYHLVFHFDANDKKLKFFKIMYYLAIKSHHKYGKADAIILHYVRLNNKNTTNRIDIAWDWYENKYFQDSLQFITHKCEWNNIPTIFGNRYYPKYLPAATSGNILRIFVTTLFGGIYYDLDVFILNQTGSNFDKLLYNHPSQTMIPREEVRDKKYGDWVLCSAVLMAQKWSMFNIEWIYQLKKRMNQIKWTPAWAQISGALPKRISDKIFIGNDSIKYIKELDTRTYFDPQWWQQSAWIENNESNNLWCHNDTNVYGWHFWNHARHENVDHFWETTGYDLNVAKEQIHIPFARILRYIEDDVPLCHHT